MKYFKKFWNETSADDLTDNWGTSWFYFETDSNLIVLKQMQVFENGRILKYDGVNMEDEFGGLADQELDPEEFEGNEISSLEFYQIWK